MSNTGKILVLAAMAIVLVASFVFFDIGSNWDYVFPRRAKKILAIMITGGVIAFSTIVFQTITNNRILTPSIIGLDSLYVLIQTFLVFLFGSMNLTVANKNINFIFSVSLMIVFSGFLYRLLFKKEGRNIYFLVLAGMIFGIFFESLSTFMQVLIDPNEFLVIQDRMFASFNNVNTDILFIVAILVMAAGGYFSRFIKYLDVLSLGKEQAINLGVDYDYVVKRLLFVIAIFVSISTALVGPITFLGLLAANVTYQLFHTYQHKYLISGSMLISMIALVGGQLIVERIFTFSTSLSVIINFIGGIYFIYLLLKESKSW